jgi:hypothetical protein
MSIRAPLTSLLATIAVLGGVLGPAPSASASTYDPVSSGKTILTLAGPFLRELRSHGVRLAAGAPATLKGASASFPVSAGRLDPVDAIGTAESEGALVFSAGGRKLPLKEPQLKTSRRNSPLAAKFGGGKLKLASSSRLATERSGFGFLAKVTQIRLSAGVATRLDKKLGLGRLLVGGELLGNARTEALPETVSILAQGNVSLELAGDFQAKLASLFVATNPIFPAEHPGSFTFPIAGGDLAPDGSSGALQGGGAIEFLQLGGGQVIMREPEVELGSAAALSSESELLPSPPYPGKLGRAPALGLSGGSLSSEPAARAIGLSGATVALTASTAAQLNEAFAKPQGKSDLFVAGEEAGTLSFMAAAE